MRDNETILKNNFDNRPVVCSYNQAINAMKEAQIEVLHEVKLRLLADPYIVTVSELINEIKGELK